jgi:hypothetical protein
MAIYSDQAARSLPLAQANIAVVERRRAPDFVPTIVVSDRPTARRRRGCPRDEHDRQLGRVVERGDVQEAVAVDHTDGADACDRGMHRPVVVEQGALAVPVLFDGVITAAAVVAGRRVGPKDRIFALDAAARRFSRALPERPSGGSGDRGARRDR